MTTLVLPNGQTVDEFKKFQQDPEGRGKIVGMTTWRDRVATGFGPEGSTVKKGNWRDYYDMYRNHALVRAAIDKIAKTSTNVGYDFVPRDSRAKIKKSEVKTLQDFFYQQTDFIYELRRIYKDLMIYGDAYLYIVPDRRRRPVRLKRLHPKTIHIKAKKNGQIEGYYQKDPDDVSDTPIRFEPQEILHFRIDDPDNDIYGLSPLESLKMAVSTDLYAQRFNASFFRNSGVTGTIIGVRNANPDEIQRNRKWLTENYTGPESAHKPIIIEGESIDIKKSVANHTEMGFLEGRKFIILEILAALDVPPAKVGIMESANRSNSKEQDKSFRTESVSPLQYIVETVINDGFVRKILGVRNTIFVHAEGDTRDQIEQMDYFTKGQAWGNFNVNEVRAKLGMAPVDGGDINIIMTPTGAVPLDRMQLYFQIPKTNVQDVPPTAEDPPEGEPLPTSGKPQVATASTSRAMQKSYDPAAYTLALHGAIVKLCEPNCTDITLRQAYTYLNDALDLDDMHVSHALDAVRKALTTNDPILRQGYVERAQENMSHFMIPYNQIVTTEDEEEDDDEESVS
jgi:HK97 family phage portal protein